MVIHTLIIGHTPLSENATAKPREIRNGKYFKELLADFDLGEINFASYSDWKESCDKFKPVVIITFNEYYAREIKDHKKDALLYVTYEPNQIFRKKDETEEKVAEQRKTFIEIAGIIQKIRDDGEAGLDPLRKFAAMSYDDMYQMIIQALIGERDDLRKQAWDLLMSNDGHKDFIWMRAQLICEVWDHADAKGKEEFLCMAMDQHIENGTAKELECFTDSEGMEFRQYEFLYPDGWGAKYIRRIPVATKGMDKWGYVALIEKYQTPNGPQMMLEAGQAKQLYSEYWEKVLAQE